MAKRNESCDYFGTKEETDVKWTEAFEWGFGPFSRTMKPPSTEPVSGSVTLIATRRNLKTTKSRHGMVPALRFWPTVD